MRLLSLAEYRTTPSIALSQTQRELLQALAPSMGIAPSRGLEDHFDLTPSSWVGAIELPDLSIEIRPKVPVERVFFLLSYALNPKAWRQTSFAFGTTSLVEAMIPPFTAAVAAALRRGVLQGYRVEEDALPTVRGRIRFDEQVKRRYGRIPPVHVEFDDFTEDIELNRLLKSAIGRLGRLHIRSAPARRSLRAFDHALERVGDVDYDARQLPETHFTRLNEHYRQAVELAKLILRSTSLELRHGGHRGAAFLVNMNRVFEDFVVVALRESLRVSEREFPQGARRRLLWLDRRRRIRLRPDLSWWVDGRCLFVGDVKYKRVQVAEIEHPDVYQLLAYTVATGLERGLLVYSADEAEPVEHEVVLAGKRLRIATLDLRDEPEQILERVDALARHVLSMRESAEASTSDESGLAA